MCMLLGENCRKSQRICLTRNATSFRRGETNQFEVRAAWLGPLTGLIVGHDNSGNFPGWQLRNIIVEHVAT
eukprot:Pgem_evm1s17688